MKAATVLFISRLASCDIFNQFTYSNEKPEISFRQVGEILEHLKTDYPVAYQSPESIYQNRR